MKRFFILIALLSILSTSHAFSSYQAKYDLFADTDLGNFNIGKVVFDLEVEGNKYVYSSDASTAALWSALYDYTRTETSIGIKDSNDLVSSYYILNEDIKGTTKNNYEIHFFQKQNFATYNGEVYIGEIEPGGLVDNLSVYLALSEDMKSNPNQKVYNYQVANSDGINRQDFTVDGIETITINEKDIETIRILCPELDLSLNLSEEYGYLPVSISKNNGKNHFYMILKEYTKYLSKGISINTDQ